MSDYRTLNEMILSRSTSQKGIAFIESGSHEYYISYSVLLERALRVLGDFQRKGFKPGEEIIFQIDNNETFLEVFWGCLLGGFIPVPVSIGNNDEHRSKLIRIWGILNQPRLLTEEKPFTGLEKYLAGNAPLFHNIKKKTVLVNDVDFEGELGTVHHASPEDIAFIQFSSGSTGDPKGVTLTHDNLVTNVNAIAKGFKVREGDAYLSWMPLTHDMGLIACHLMPITADIEQIIMPTSLFIYRPMMWLLKAQQYKATLLASPNFGYHYVLSRFKEESAKGLDLSSVRLIANGAEPISPSLCDRFLEKFEPYHLNQASMFTVYGLAEASVGAAVPEAGERFVSLTVDRRHLQVGELVHQLEKGDVNGIDFVETGTAIQDCYIRICDEKDQEMGDGYVGYIQISGRNVTSGYYNNPEATKKAKTKDGWINTGDLGFKHNGQLVVTGRAKDIIFINGQNIYPHDIERVTEGLHGIGLNQVAACGVWDANTLTEKIVLFVLYKGKIENFVRIAVDIKEHLSRKMGLEIHGVLPIRKIPKTTSGKIQRFKLATEFESGDWDVLLNDMEEQIAALRSSQPMELPSTSTEERVFRLWTEIMERQAGINDGFWESGGNSLKAARLVNSLNSEFHADWSISDLFLHSSIQKIAAALDEGGPVNHHELAATQADACPASSAQTRVYLACQNPGAELAYHLTFSLASPEPWDRHRLSAALQHVMMKHESLRTSFEWDHEDLMQRISPSASVNIDEIGADEAEWPDIIARFVRPFDLSQPSLMRALLIHASSKSIAVFDQHHLISDGPSISIFIQELIEQYNGQPGQPLAVQYKDYAQWQQKRLHDPELISGKEDYWLHEFAGELPTLSLPEDYPRTMEHRFEGDHYSTFISPELHKSLDKLAKQTGSSLFMVLLAAYHVMLAKWSNQRDIISGILASDRQHQNVEPLIGMFINTLALRTKPDGNLTFEQFVRQVRTKTINALKHGDYPFDRLVEQLDIQYDPTRNPLINTMMVMHNYDVFPSKAHALGYEAAFHDSKHAKFDLTLTITEHNEGLLADFEYASHLFQRETIERMVNSFEKIIVQAATDGSVLLSEINVLPENDMRLISSFNKTEKDVVANTIIESIRTSCDTFPDKPALIFEGRIWTYQDVWEKSLALAAVLGSKGIRSGELAAIMMRRSPEMVVSMLAVILAGAAYVPVDPEFPAERVAYILSNSGARILLHDGSAASVDYQGEKLAVEEALSVSGGSAPLVRITHQLSELCYVMYTSGSTGNPKGVMITHDNLANFFTAMDEIIQPGYRDVMLAVTTFSFDISIVELLWTLSKGLTVVMKPEEIRDDFNQYMVHDVTLFQTTPSRLVMLLEDINSHDFLQSLQTILVGGESLPLSLVHKIRQITNARILNMYGPTETTIWSSYQEIHGDEAVRIGQPIANTEIFVFDLDGNPAPIGVIGEIYIGGRGVAPGYFNQPQLTEERFVPSPWSLTGLLYRTGDLGRLGYDGRLECCGRNDSQVKVRGYRVELNEIEQKLSLCFGVKDAAVIHSTDEHGDGYLAGFFTSSEQLDQQAIRNELKRSLPNYMVPTYLTQISEMPMTPNGKIARNALIPHSFDREEHSTCDDSNIQSDVSGRLCKMVAEIIKLREVRPSEHFFELGGHSLHAARLVARLNSEFEIKLSITDIFNNPVLRDLVNRISEESPQAIDTIKRVPILPHYPTSSAQKRLYILNQRNVNKVSYNMPFMLKIEGELDRDRCKTVFRQLIQRHEAFQTSFHWQNGELVQIIRPETSGDLQVLNITEEELEPCLTGFVKPFDLGKAPLLRGALLSQSDTSHVLLIDQHHIVSDGTSAGILLKEFFDMYNDKSLPDLSITYKDYSSWTLEEPYQSNMQQAEEYWLHQLSGELPVLQLPTDFPRRSGSEREGGRVVFHFDEELAARLYHLAAESNSTLYMILLASYQLFLSELTRQDDILVGSLVSGRNRSELEPLIGMFVNTVVIRQTLKPEYSFREHLAEVRSQVMDMYTHQDYAFEELVHKLPHGIRGHQSNPIFDTMFILQNMDIDNAGIPNCSVTLDLLDTGSVKFDLMLTAMEQSNGIRFDFEYSSSLFTRESICSYADQFTYLVQQIVAAPDKALNLFRLFPSEQEHVMLTHFNRNKASFPEDITIHEIFEQTAKTFPDRTAVVYEGESLTYARLNGLANRLASTLRDYGLGTDQLAVIILDRSLEMIVTILAVLKAGGAYVPVDPDYPADRIQYMLEDSGSKLLITKGGLKKGTHYSGTIIDLDEHTTNQEQEKGPDVTHAAHHLAYVIYTSGSTGKPKGVQVEHRQVISLMKNDAHLFDFHAQDVWTMFHSYCFDFSVWEMYGALLCGGKLIVVPKETARNPYRFLKLLQSEKVTILNQTPSAFYYLMQQERMEPECDLSIRTVIFGGEALKPKMVKEWKQKYPDIKLINMYGITETTVHVTYKELNQVDLEENISNIGVPLPTLNVYILDHQDRPVPIGVAGEMYVSGAGVARGYLNRMELTQERFLEDPFEPGLRMYRTGDLARWLKDGSIEYIGRDDHQVKIRGFRIEMGEIENQLMEFEDVQNVVVIDRTSAQGEKYLVAYFVAARSISSADLQAQLSLRLPYYMVPARFVQVHEMPLTVNGKIDRAKLPEPVIELEADLEDPPTNETEERLAEIWKTLLGRDRIHVSTNFFALGGHSLLAASLSSHINQVFNVSIPLKELFDHTTVREQARLIRNMRRSSLPARITSAEPSDAYPLTSAQKRLYLLHQLEPESVQYNVAGGLEIRGFLETELVAQAIQQLIDRHESLRTSYHMKKGEPVQVIHSDVKSSLDIYHLDGAAYDTDQFVRPFDLSQAPLIRFSLLSKSRDHHILLMDVHHIAADGTSVNLILQDVMRFYNGIQLPKLDIHYKDYAVWKNNHPPKQEQQSFWLDSFAGEVPVLQLPTDYKREVIQTYEGDMLVTWLNSQQKTSLLQLAQNTGTTLYMLLLACFNVLLAKYSGQEDIVVGTPIAGRTQVELEKIVGMFVNTLAIRTFPQESKSFNRYLLEVREHVLNSFDNQDYPFEDLVDQVQVHRDLSRNPLFDVFFAMQNIRFQPVAMRGLEVKRYELEHKISKFDLSLFAIEEENGIRCEFEYSKKLFNPQTIERMADHFSRLVNAITSHPAAVIANLPLIGEAEFGFISQAGRGKERAFTKKDIHQWIEERAEKNPETSAIVWEDGIVSYKELNRHANQLAHQLLRLGMDRGERIGICIERKPELIVGMLAVLKSGCSYVPLDPNLPKERLIHMASTAHVKVILTASETAFDLTEPMWNVMNIHSDEYLQKCEHLPDVNPVCPADSNDAMYTIFTSGSTGVPKGASVYRKGFANLLHWYTQEFEMNADDRMLLMTSPSFDLTQKNIYAPLVTGGTLYLLPEGHYDHEAIVSTIHQHRITMLNCTPSAFYPLVAERENYDLLTSLQQVFLGGEPIHKERLRDWALYEKNRAEIVNTYGPTECTDVTIYHRLTGQDWESERDVPLGRPIMNSQIYILNPALQPVPIGVHGEIYIGGICVGGGYVNDNEKTNERFIANPFGDKDCPVLYRTGDLGRMTPDGNLEYLGRTDHQVKIRGYRIELAEVETQVVWTGEVKDAAVITKKDGSGENYLCGFVVLAEGSRISTLRSKLSLRLPSYMIPSRLVILDEMPLTNSGKIDRKALADMDLTNALNDRSEIAVPKSEIETWLAGLWAELLSIPLEGIGLDCNFFELGGHSLKATALVYRIKQELGAAIQLRDIFTSPTIRELALKLEGSSKARLKAIPKAPLQSAYTVSSAQKRLLLIDHLNDAGTSYNMPNVIRLEGKLEVDKLQKALQSVVSRHEIFRTTFSFVKGLPVQIIADEMSLPLPFISASEEELKSITNEFIQPFDLERGPLLRVLLVKHAAESQTLLIDMHHIIGDGASFGVLVHELADLYEGRELPEPILQYKDYSEWQRALHRTETFQAQADYWLHQFQDGGPKLNLPTDFQRPNTQHFNGDHISFRLEASVTEQIGRYLQEAGITMYVYLLSVYKVLLSKYAGQQELVVGMPIAGRLHPELENVIGMFVNTLPIRSRVDWTHSFDAYVKELNEIALQSYENQEYPFEMLVEKLDLENREGRNPLFDTVFVLQNNELPNLQFNGLNVTRMELERKNSIFDLKLEATEIDGELLFILDYRTDLFRRESVERMAQDFIGIVETTLQDSSLRIKEIELQSQLAITSNKRQHENVEFRF
ncbi:non-ribosomal peptide synthetase [Paenibacillus thiaminolyticus]|uniref:non-ribosomal peptide synthetase n=1 Tax=Paenibacillus thiaminolyticus TaxID=49283 RepID=UPI0025429B85|nr:non-ribosomal peptide synthetase [Paenibacillus thiaminolyticus]WII35950.1 amino acid adenylation domain-containing protein [Paenibacillus thiaminolyticus]